MAVNSRQKYNFIFLLVGNVLHAIFERVTLCTIIIPISKTILCYNYTDRVKCLRGSIRWGPEGRKSEERNTICLHSTKITINFNKRYFSNFNKFTQLTRQIQCQSDMENNHVYRNCIKLITEEIHVEMFVGKLYQSGMIQV